MEPTVILLIVVTVAATVPLRSIREAAEDRVPKSARAAMTGLNSSGQQILLHTDPHTHTHTNNGSTITALNLLLYTNTNIIISK